MSVVGIDLGNDNTVIAVARNRGIDVIANEVSNRATPSLVAFGAKNRYIGESAKTQEISNLRNTVGSLKRLLGRTFSDSEMKIEQDFIPARLVDVKGAVGAEVDYLREKVHFTNVQLVAAYLSKIKATTSAEIKGPVTDCVLSVPAWFTDGARRALVDAAEVAGLNPLRIINDTTAAALGYGITKTDLPEEKPRIVAFVDIGHSNYTVSVVAFLKGGLTVRSCTWDRHFGGRDFDKALTDHFASEFKSKYGIDVLSNPKAHFRVRTAVEKVKKILSANLQAPLNIESVMNDVDVTALITRPEMEALVEPLLQRVHDPLARALAAAKLSPADIDAVEMVGGCTRVPCLKERIAEFFGKPLSFTLNQDEAIARGCAFACAIVSPVFRVRDFVIHDTINYPVEFSWETKPDIPDEESILQVFPAGNTVPSTKILTFYRKEPFDLEAHYVDARTLPGTTTPWIARFAIKGVTPNSTGDFSIVKVKARANVYGLVNVESAYVVEEQEVEEVVKEKPSEKEKPKEKVKEKTQKKDKPKGEENETEKEQDTDMAGDEPAKEPEEEPEKVRRVKKMVRKADLSIVAASHALELGVKQALSERENQMIVEDKLMADTEDRKNALEEYIYEMRGKIDDLYAKFASEQEKQTVRQRLSATEDWLYDDGEDATKAVYVAKFEELMSLGGPIRMRYLDAENEKKRLVEEKIAKEKAAAAEARAAETKAAEQRAAEAKATQTADKEVNGDANPDTAMTDASDIADVD